MMKNLKYVLLLLLLSACHNIVSNKTAQTKKVNIVKIEKVIDSNLLSAPGAIVVQPSSRMINKMKKEIGSEDFSTVVDDNVYYMSLSEQYLDSVKAKQVQRMSEGAVGFKTASGQTFNMKLDTIFFGVILFNGKDKPIHADMTDFQTDYKKYMQR